MLRLQVGLLCKPHHCTCILIRNLLEFFASQGQGAPMEIDEATDKRLRWMIHKRVLVRSLLLAWFSGMAC